MAASVPTLSAEDMECDEDVMYRTTLLVISRRISSCQLEQMIFLTKLHEAEKQQVGQKPLNFIKLLESRGDLSKSDFQKLQHLLSKTLCRSSYREVERIIRDFKTKSKIYRQSVVTQHPVLVPAAASPEEPELVADAPQQPGLPAAAPQQSPHPNELLAAAPQHQGPVSMDLETPPVHRTRLRLCCSISCDNCCATTVLGPTCGAGSSSHDPDSRRSSRDNDPLQLRNWLCCFRTEN